MSTLRLESDHCGGLGGDSRLYRSEKLSQAAIARQQGLSRNTVANALASEAPPRYERAPVTTSAWAQVEPAVRVLLGQYC
ncbi:hypothetical protein C8E89_14532 [Mycolicibacterium moriokaense]|uniref:Uncharacterized protein n=1 Tax=Mycolicibacterium moriokaense TaxID=39691 RepID=A0A318HBZ7_9MYCO|nr:hypothetical protein C8E89_14532 [Mycolicibacterium moriokaense]